MTQRPLRSYVVIEHGTKRWMELLSRSRTQALVDGAELMGVEATKLRVIELHDF